MSSSFSNAPKINISQRWVQVGEDINGAENYGRSGYSVSLSGDGKSVAVGVPTIGLVRIFKNDGNNWVNHGESNKKDRQGGNSSGESIAISSDGSVVAVGEPDYQGEIGQVSIFQNDNGVLTQIGNDIDGASNWSKSGHSISLSSDGNIVAIGAYKESPPHPENEFYLGGRARIYQNNNGSWEQIGSAFDGANGDSLGYSVSLSSDGSIVAIGSIWANTDSSDENYATASDVGSVKIYQNDNGNWTQIGKDIFGGAERDNLGRSVSLSSDGSIVAAGAYNEDDNAGYVKIYQNDNGNWTQIGDDIKGETEGDRSGHSISLSSDGSIVAIGAPRNDGKGADSGHVRIFQNIEGKWKQIGEDINGEAGGDLSGYSVSLSDDGSIVAIGAYGNDGNGLEVVKEIQSNNSSSRIIMLTGYGNIPTAVAAIKEGAIDYLAKPADADDVEKALLADPNKKAVPPENPMSADRVKWEHIHRVFELCNRNVSETARRLKMHRRTLQRILSKRSPK